ncbi:MAG: cysteine dioxygenase [Phycisphaerales bacterium JB039]
MPIANPKQACPKLAPLIEYLEGLEARADLKVLERLLREVEVTRADIGPACSFGVKAYKRNSISRGQWHELVALCWRSGDVTPIHDHEGSSCAFKVIEGDGTEIRFKRTPSGLVCPDTVNDMPEGYLCSADDADIHQVANMQAPGTDLITLHIYSPPIVSMRTYRFSCRSPVEVLDMATAAEQG